MANKRPWTRTLYVEIAATDDPCSPDFNLDGYRTFHNDHRPGFILYFDIKDPDGTGCVFDPDDPLWVDGDTIPPVCPPVNKSWPQFFSIDVINDGQTLIVRNKNIDIQKFSFMLRFRRPGCRNAIEFDPIGNNQNGQQS